MRKTRPKVLGRHLVADPQICHGEMTFVGTRILVSDVLAEVADGMAWESIIEGWHGRISKEAITEAVQLAGKALVTHSDEFVLGAAAA